LAEAAWCLLALVGAEQLMERWPAAEGVAKVVCAVILVGLGIYFFTRKASVPSAEDKANIVENYYKDFWLGFSLVGGNISVPLNWLGFLTIAVGMGFHPEEASPVVFIAGVALGIIGWFALLLKLLDIFRSRISHQHIQWIMRAMGLLLVVTVGVTFWG